MSIFTRPSTVPGSVAITHTCSLHWIRAKWNTSWSFPPKIWIKILRLTIISLWIMSNLILTWEGKTKAHCYPCPFQEGSITVTGPVHAPTWWWGVGGLNQEAPEALCPQSVDQKMRLMQLANMGFWGSGKEKSTVGCSGLARVLEESELNKESGRWKRSGHW